MKINTIRITACCLAAFTCASQAQTYPSSSSIETISVIGSRVHVDKYKVSAAITRFSREQIQQSGATQLHELLRSVPNMNISQTGPTGALTEVRFRGSESNHVLVMVDGVEINDLGQGGLIDLSHITLANVSSIEILKGPQSALWGSNAVAGVINIVTIDEQSQGRQGQIGIGLGNTETRTANASITYQQDKVSANASISHLNTEGGNIARVGNEADGYENTSAAANVSYAISNNQQLMLNARWVDYRSEFDAIDYVNTGLPIDANNHSIGEQSSLNLSWQAQPSQSIWSSTLSYQFSQQQNSNFADDLFTGSSKGTKQRFSWLNHFDLSEKAFINVGAEWVDEDFEQAGPVSFGDPNQIQNNHTTSIFVDGHYLINKQLNINYSYRFDDNTEFAQANSYRAGLSYQINALWRAFASIGEAIKNPSFTERFGFYSDTFIGNPELKPESSNSRELGLEFTQTAWASSISLFDTRLTNEINGFVFVPEQGAFSADNSEQESSRRGLEISMQGQFEYLNWQLSYAYLDAQDATSVELRRARHTGSAMLNSKLSDTQSFYLQADYTGTRFDRFFPPFPQASRVESLGAYWLVSANYRYQFNPQLTFSLRGENLTNHRYEDVFGFVGQQRRISLNMNYSWQ